MSKGSGIFGKALFCPFCGAESLNRDHYGETLEPPRYKNEFVCFSCGKEFCLVPSMAWQSASRLHKEHRGMRPPDELPPKKERPADEELYTLEKYAEKIGVKGVIERCRSGRFVWRDVEGKAHGSTSFETMKAMLRGFQIAQFEAKQKPLASVADARLKTR